MKIAGLKECGLCCEVMRNDGTMMRAGEVQEKAKEWGFKFITIQAIKDYRKCNDVLVERVVNSVR